MLARSFPSAMTRSILATDVTGDGPPVGVTCLVYWE
jgi:hypothetical protein